MNFDELMAVWKSQDAAPLHGVNKTLLHQVLRQDEAKLQKERRIVRWMIYVSGAGIVATIALFLTLMIHFHGQAPEKHGVVTAWDYLMGMGGAAAALLTGGAMYVGHRAQARREQRFGESLRDQLNRRIAQLDDAATGGHRTDVLILVAMGGICPIAILHFGRRINNMSISFVSYVMIALIICYVWWGVRGVRRSVQRDLSRKHRLEALRKELDGQ